MRVLIFGCKSSLGQSISANSYKFKTVVYYANPYTKLEEVFEKYQPEAIINCLGTDKNPLDMLYYNATFPHILANSTDVPIYHVSTDKVFNGHGNYRYTPKDATNATTMFGRTCVLGEVDAPHVRNIRTSFIVRDRGFSKAVLNDDFVGHANVRWSGSTVEAVARGILHIINHPEYTGIVHLSTVNSISRYDIAKILLCHAGFCDRNIEKSLFPTANFSLAPTVVLQPLQEAVKEW